MENVNRFGWYGTLVGCLEMSYMIALTLWWKNEIFGATKPEVLSIVNTLNDGRSEISTVTFPLVGHLSPSIALAAFVLTCCMAAVCLVWLPTTMLNAKTHKPLTFITSATAFVATASGSATFVGLFRALRKHFLSLGSYTTGASVFRLTNSCAHNTFSNSSFSCTPGAEADCANVIISWCNDELWKISSCILFTTLVTFMRLLTAAVFLMLLYDLASDSENDGCSSEETVVTQHPATTMPFPADARAPGYVYHTPGPSYVTHSQYPRPPQVLYI